MVSVFLNQEFDIVLMLYVFPAQACQKEQETFLVLKLVQHVQVNQHDR